MTQPVESHRYRESGVQDGMDGSVCVWVCMCECARDKNVQVEAFIQRCFLCPFLTCDRVTKSSEYVARRSIAHSPFYPHYLPTHQPLFHNDHFCICLLRITYNFLLFSLSRLYCIVPSHQLLTPIQAHIGSVRFCFSLDT